MKTNSTYNTEVIDVNFNTWVDANVHLPEIKHALNGMNDYPFIDLKRDYLSKDKDEKSEAIYRLKEIIKSVKEKDGRKLSLDEALEYYEKNDIITGCSNKVLFYLKINNLPKIVAAIISQSDHNDFDLVWEDSEQLHMPGFGKTQGKLKINKDYKHYEILKWTPLPNDNKSDNAVWFKCKQKPKNFSRLIAMVEVGFDDYDYKILYYIDNKFICDKDEEVVEWMYLPDVLKNEFDKIFGKASK